MVGKDCGAANFSATHLRTALMGHHSGGSTQPHKSGTSLLYSWPGRAAYLRVCIKEVGNSRVPGSRPAQPLTLGAPGCSMATCRSLFITSDPQHFKQRPPQFLIQEYSLLRNKREVQLTLLTKCIETDLIRLIHKMQIIHLIYLKIRATKLSQLMCTPDSPCSPDPAVELTAPAPPDAPNVQDAHNAPGQNAASDTHVHMMVQSLHCKRYNLALNVPMSLASLKEY